VKLNTELNALLNQSEIRACSRNGQIPRAEPERLRQLVRKNWRAGREVVAAAGSKPIRFRDDPKGMR